MAAVALVALVHDDAVLVTADDALPELAIEDEDESDEWFAGALDLVGGDVFLAPVLELAPHRYLTVVGCRARPVPAGPWLPAGRLPTEVAGLVSRTMREYDGEPPALRPDWFRPGWYDRVEAWVDAALARVGRRRTGLMVVVRVWSISAVLRIPTTGGDVWFKAACDLFRDEAAIHRVVAEHFPDDVPVLLAEDDRRGWLLMDEMAGATEESRHAGAAAALAARWPQVQLASLDRRAELRTAGCAVRDAEATVAGFHRVLTRSHDDPRLSPEELRELLAVAPEAEAMVRELWDCGLPDALAHGDLHLGNVAYDGSTLRIFDWTDGCLTQPLLDGCHLAQFDERREVDHALLAAFAEPWRAAFPDARVDDAIRLVPVVNLVFQVDTFERIFRATEPASMYELGGSVAWILRRLPPAVADARVPRS